MNDGTFATSINTGSDHSDVSNNGIIEKYCYNNNAAYCDTFGGLYEWDEMMQYALSDNGNPCITQGICPDGWHLPTYSEWSVIETYLGGSSIAGGKLKDTSYWASPNTGADNSSGFTCMPVGHSVSLGDFGGLGECSYFWTATEYDATFPWIRYLNYNDANLNQSHGSYKLHGFPVRCLKSNCSDILVNNTASICDGQSLTVGIHTYTVTGIYHDTIPLTGGCDSIITTDLTVNPNPTVSLGNDTTVCGSITLNANASGGMIPYSYNWNTGCTDEACLVSIAGTYDVTVTDANGCTGTDEINISILQSSIVNLQSSICEGQSYTLPDGSTTATAGIYIDTLQTTNGCDSIITTNLTVNPVYSISESVAICSGQSYTLPDGSTTSTAGTYIDTLQTINGCDSIITTTLTLYPIPYISLGNDTTICANASITLTAGGSGNSYQWSNGLYAPSITVSNSGVYSVTVTNAYGCSATDNITVSKYTAIQINVSVTNAACGQHNGSAAAFVSGGTPPYSFLWNNGDTVQIITGLNPGVYQVYVTDAAGCQNFATAVVSTSNGPQIAVAGITNVSCFGGSDGAITITVTGGAMPYTYNWSTGVQTPNLASLTAGPYEIIVTDADTCQAVRSIIVTQPAQLEITISTANASCGNADGQATSTVTGGTSPYAYNWSAGVQTPNLASLSAGIYSLTVTDAHSCTATATAAISESGAATVTIDSIVNPICNGMNGAIYISVSGGTNFIYNWSDLSASQDLAGVQAGDYSVTVTSGGCNAVAHSTISEIQPLLQPICIISVDNTTNLGKNMLVWEKQQTAGISLYKIWKETTQAGVYQVVATIPYAVMSKWTDPLSNPHQRAWRYKISSVDSCGTESPLSIVHKTMHLTVNLGQGQDINLIWNHYQGFEYYTYYIHRYRPSTGWLVIDSIPGDINTYTDTPLGGGAVRYFVAAKRDNECWASGDAKDMSGPFSQSLSNIEDNGIIDVNVSQTKIDELNCKIYPNPANNKIFVESGTDFKDAVITVYNINSQILLQQPLQKKTTELDISGFSAGIYFVKLETKDGVGVWKLVKE